MDTKGRHGKATREPGQEELPDGPSDWVTVRNSSERLAGVEVSGSVSVSRGSC